MEISAISPTDDKTTVYITDGPIISEDDEAMLVREREVTGEKHNTQSKRMFEENAPAAAKTIIMLAKHGSNERTRLQASTYIIERVLGRIQDNPPEPEDSPYDRLVAECVRFVAESGDLTTQSVASRVEGTHNENHSHCDSKDNSHDVHNDTEVVE